jgi:hypothetical protein
VSKSVLGLLGSTWRISSSSPLYGLSAVVGSPLKEEIRVWMFSWRECSAMFSKELPFVISKDFVSVVCCSDLFVSDFVSVVCCSDFHNLPFRNLINSCGLSLKSQMNSLIS